ncbi:glycosyltransferase [Azospirillum picis]|uniref:Glycosyltransferase involved in cell wall biosynthesis n=1 Tax=Azospirillum picis TaxID=488438 RepID=A0ABU0MGV1_9PROT|nr:glycosyltransferase [Azospirillum picis]MBP2299095.1 glycosyltransferase involved in cell wall biosynthesis [Azospirillum picis]MDQ0532663.1 glycosyltransferase involved in cell wall biosynthesis [Azospirillum picis]
MPLIEPPDHAGEAVAALLAYLGDSQFDAGKIERFSALCDELRRGIGLEGRLALAERLEADAPIGDTIRLRSVLFLLTGDLYHYERILHYLLLGGEAVDPAQMHYVHWCLSRQLFLGIAGGEKLASFVPCDLFRYYTALVRRTTRSWRLAPAAAPLRDGPIRRVAVVTNQFTNRGHQPTRDCFDYAARLQDDFGLDVAIINVNGLPGQVENLFIPPMVAEVVEDMEGVFAMRMLGRQVKVASFTGRAFNRDKLSLIVEAIDGYDPDLILAFGGSNIVADLFADAAARPVLCLPTSSGVTLSLAPVVLGFDERDHTASIPALYREPFARRFRPFTFGYTLPPSDGDRIETGFAEGTILFAVVGTRLDHEVTGEVLSLFDDILDRCPDAGLVFAGEVVDLPARLAKARNHGRMRCLGHVGDIRALYRRCRVFLNPPRQGGGGGAAFALAEGVPVVTYDWGDGASVSGPSFCVADRTAYVERAVALANAGAAGAEAAEAAARSRFAEVGDRRRCVERLLAYGEEVRTILRGQRGG